MAGNVLSLPQGSFTVRQNCLSTQNGGISRAVHLLPSELDESSRGGVEVQPSLRCSRVTMVSASIARCASLGLWTSATMEMVCPASLSLKEWTVQVYRRALPIQEAHFQGVVLVFSERRIALGDADVRWSTSRWPSWWSGTRTTVSARCASVRVTSHNRAAVDIGCHSDVLKGSISCWLWPVTDARQESWSESRWRGTRPGREAERWPADLAKDRTAGRSTPCSFGRQVRGAPSGEGCPISATAGDANVGLLQTTGVTQARAPR